MRYYKLLLIPLTFFLFSCEKTTDKLFWILEDNQQTNDFLFLTESTNVETLTTDSLKLFLNDDELKVFDSTSTTFKNFGQIHQGQKFKVFILLRSIDTFGRDYTFLIRTYDKDWKLIGDFELGTWDEREKRYCFGSINKDLIIERKCKDKGTSDKMQITDEGKIIMTSFHKP